MKKILALILAVLLVLCLFTACEPSAGDNIFVSPRFQVLSCETKNTLHEVIAVDRATNVMYLVFYSNYIGGITPLYNQDGSIMTYDGDIGVFLPPYDPED